MTVRIHYYSDCESFAGCEQMIVVLMLAALRSEEIDARFAFRHSKLYASGVRQRLPAEASVEGIHLPDVNALRTELSRRLGRRVLWFVKALTYIFPLRQMFQLIDVIRLWRVFRRERCQIVQVNNGGFPGAGSCNAAALAARLANTPILIYVVNNIATGYRSPLRWADYPLDRVTRRFVTRFVTGSEEAASALLRVLNLPSDQVRSIHNGIAPRHPTRTREGLRGMLGVDPDTVILAVVARLERRKGHRFLVEALAMVAARKLAIPWVLVIEGHGPEESPLRALVADLNLSVCVRFAGRFDNVWDLYVAADVVVLPSVDQEDFPNVTLEAMAVGRPVVCSAIAGTTEQVVDGETGLLVPPRDVDMLAQALEYLILNPGARDAMGRAGRSRFEERFSAEAAATRYWSLYRELAADV